MIFHNLDKSMEKVLKISNNSINKQKPYMYPLMLNQVIDSKEAFPTLVKVAFVLLVGDSVVYQTRTYWSLVQFFDFR